MKNTEEYIHVKSFNIPLYRGKLVVVLTNCDKVKSLIPTFDTTALYASAIYDNYKGFQGYFCILNFDNELRRIKHGTIAHEAYHIANFLCTHRGIKEDLENDEPAAYLIEWIVDRIYEVCKKYGFSII